MKITAMTALAVTVIVAAQAGEPGQAAERKVTVCMEIAAADPILSVRAEDKASKMFSGIGVTLDWRQNCPADGIRISLSDHRLEERMPNAYAYAMPYEGIHIVVFYGRIKEVHDPSLRTSLFAHVLVHEITHSLQGIPRHSGEGVMKANWDGGDYSAMTWKPLVFTSDDIELIYQGLARRTARAALSRGAANLENRASSGAVMQ
jgi:hypothetical protein